MRLWGRLAVCWRTASPPSPGSQPARSLSSCPTKQPNKNLGYGSTTHTYSKLLPLSRFLQLLDLSPDDISLERAEVIDEEYAIQMIDLMLERARQQLIAA